jgi:hypothetical protein
MRDEREVEAARRQHLIAFGRIEANSVEFPPDQTERTRWCHPGSLRRKSLANRQRVLKF